ncbi:GFA family protein [Paraburkholderia sp. Ac-20340]|uniref:GFA family protein n=1 Tax=Paraburkholderia sp. Ac-20340 TaxID=2703888 RepID=UPI00197F1C5F|nr:GFA family protein [Paraburkholderia sp. Ac-20340]MBN3853654.1 GFA family protein [Paraburkholderia sp. Ac-20340]
MRQGGCLCGSVRYEIAGEPIGTTACHCVDCRRASGAPFVGWMSVSRDAFKLVAGATKSYASSEGVERAFCPECGTPLTYRSAAYADEIDVATGTLDAPGAAPPEDHTWTSQQLDWVQLADDLPTYPRNRE